MTKAMWTKFLAALLVVVMLFAVVACQPKEAEKDNEQEQQDNTPTVKYERADEEAVYEAVLGNYADLMDAAKAADSIDERFVLFAKAEAYMLESAVMIPTTTQGGAYTLSRVAPHTVPYVQWGNDDDRFFGMVISSDLITKEERADLLEAWNKALVGEGTYDPAAYLTSKGHTINPVYNLTFATAPVTLDWLNTSSQADTEITVNTVDGLVQYDNLNRMNPALAESWTVSDDGLTYTFKIREGVYWYTSEGTQYAEVTAEDFVSGFHHMLDAQAGLEWLVEGVVAGAHEYLKGESFDGVGYKATDKYTLTVTLEAPTSYFLTMLTYSCFLPICTSFYEAKGGVYGIAEYKEAQANTDAYTFGKNTDVASQVYCGPFLLTQLDPDSQITIRANQNYYNKDNVALTEVNWYKDNGENALQTYADVIGGKYPGMGLSAGNGTLEKAKQDGWFDTHAYVSDTNSTTYFGGLNVARGTFALKSGAVASPKTEQQKIDAAKALLNKNFRQALQFAFDRGTWNAILRGDDLKYTNLRNMYTHPEFVSIANEVTVDGKTWPAGTFYGEIVQFYLQVMGSPIQVQDGIDGWFNVAEAKKALEKAKTELGNSVTWPIQIDVVYYSANPNQVAQAQSYKQSIEDNLGKANVIVNLVEATTSEDYYASGYRAADGKAGNFDMFYGSGWGPDYGDPSTYLDTFLGDGEGYMTKVIGLF